AAPTSPRSPAKPPTTPSAATAAATWAGSPWTSSAPNSATRSRACRTARFPPRSAPRPAGTSCSGSPPARSTSTTRTVAPGSGRRSACASWRTSGTASSASCAARPSSKSAPGADMRRPRLALVPGEPAGVGPELCVRAAHREWGADLVAFGDRGNLLRAARAIGLGLDFAAPDAPAVPSGTLRISDVPLEAAVEPGRPDPRNARAVVESLARAASGCLAGTFDGIVTGPVHKATVNAGGIAYTGTTELLAAQAGRDVVMMLANDVMRVALATTHLPLRGVPDAITRDGL